MAKTKQQTTRPSERYHGPLITNGASLGYLKIYPWINLPFSIFFATIGFIGWYDDHLGIIKGLFLACIIINVISLLFSFFHSLVNRFKSLAYILVALITWTTLMWTDFIGLVIFISKNNSTTPDDFSSSIVLFYVIPILLLFFISCSVYAWYYLPKNQGKVWKFNQKRTKDKKSAFANNFWITFGAVVVVPPLLTGYLQNAFGLLLGVLMTSTLTAVIVDAIYAAIYVRKHPNEDAL